LFQEGVHGTVAKAQDSAVGGVTKEEGRRRRRLRQRLKEQAMELLRVKQQQEEEEAQQAAVAKEKKEEEVTARDDRARAVEVTGTRETIAVEQDAVMYVQQTNKNKVQDDQFLKEGLALQRPGGVRIDFVDARVGSTVGEGVEGMTALGGVGVLKRGTRSRKKPPLSTFLKSNSYTRPFENSLRQEKGKSGRRRRDGKRKVGGGGGIEVKSGVEADVVDVRASAVG
jgi:hypothetical protein